jgi:hypothetical protein
MVVAMPAELRLGPDRPQAKQVQCVHGYVLDMAGSSCFGDAMSTPKDVVNLI